MLGKDSVSVSVCRGSDSEHGAMQGAYIESWWARFVVQMYMVSVLCRGPESAVRSSYVQDDFPSTLDYPERLQRGRVQKQESG